MEALPSWTAKVVCEKAASKGQSSDTKKHDRSGLNLHVNDFTVKKSQKKRTRSKSTKMYQSS